MKEEFFANVYKPYIAVEEQAIEHVEMKVGDHIDISVGMGQSIQTSEIKNMVVASIIDCDILRTVIFMKNNIFIVAVFANSDCTVRSVTLYGSEVHQCRSILVRSANSDIDWAYMDGNLAYPKVVFKKGRRILSPGDILVSSSHREDFIVEYIAKDGSIVAYRKVNAKGYNQSDVHEYRSIMIRRTDDTIIKSLNTKLDWCA